MIERTFAAIDWFIPGAVTLERSDLSISRNFVFTHIVGPLMSQMIGVYLYRADPNPGFAFWTIEICITLFWALPFVLKYTNNIRLAAFLSVELLAFTSLFGTYFYGGVSSPFLPWLLVALLLGFFYLSDRPLVVVCLFAVNISALLSAYLAFGFPVRVPLAELSSVGWLSILSATIYMAWMAIYYASVMSMRSEVERETERHRLTTEKLSAAKVAADAANQSKSIFLAKMSHEFRTPLNAVIGYSELLLEAMEDDGADEQKKKDMTRINSAGKHLLSLVADVLDLSKIESDTIDLKQEYFSLSELIDQVVATTQPMAQTNRNQLVVQRAAGLGYMMSDATKLRQVILNILSNAAKFTSDGVITLIARRQKTAAGDWIEILVRDTGIGIAQDAMGKLFQNFSQASAATSSKYGGTGLGLALSQRFCALMGGSITMTSELGHGSCFTVRVPADIGNNMGITEEFAGVASTPVLSAIAS